MNGNERGDRLAGRVAVVTGAGQGIGKGIASAFASEGANVVVLDRDGETAARTAAECEARGADAMALGCDVAERDDVDSAVDAATDRFGRVDILVTCALPKLIVQPFEQTDPGEIDTMWRVGYLGVVNAMRACAPHLKEHGGAVINFGSGAGIHGSAGYASYAPVKEAVRAISRVAAREWGAFGVRVNVICPFARSEQFDEWAVQYPEQARMAAATTLLGRLGDCEADIGRCAVFLAGDDAAFVTGQTLMVDGGQTMA
jgi:NAD(P)-dependent dehydrogenase (short-subunit alcohol dehydrogenase family)